MQNTVRVFTLQLGTEVIDFELRMLKRSKNLRISIKPETGLVVSSPPWITLDEVKAVLSQKQAWILKHLKDNPYDGARSYNEGQLLPFLGENLSLEIAEGDKAKVVRYSGKLKASLPAGLAGRPRSEALKLALEQWYIAQAKKVIPLRVAEINREIGLTYNRITIRGQQTRWGSCSRLNNLNFNWRLVLAPPDVLDYVIIHELAHLKELNHSHRFWQLVESICPNYRPVRKWLKQHGATLRL